jgi:hypothetical protein
VVDELLLHQVPSGRGQHYLWVEARGIDACSCIGYDLFDELFSVILLLWIGNYGFEIILDIIELVLLAALEVDLLAGLFLTGLLSVEVEVLNGEHV